MLHLSLTELAKGAGKTVHKFPKKSQAQQSSLSIQASQSSIQHSHSSLHSLPQIYLNNISNQFNQRGQGAGGYGQSPYSGGQQQQQQQQQQRPGAGSAQNKPDAASQDAQGEGYDDPNEQDLDPNTPSPQQSKKQPGQPQRPGQGQAQPIGTAGQVAKKPDGAAGAKKKADVAPRHAHSRFAQDPHHHATMQQFANIAKAGMTHDHIHSLVHVGTLALAMLAHSSGMTAGHEEEDEEDKQ